VAITFSDHRVLDWRMMAYSTTAPVTRVAHPRAGRVQQAARRVYASRVQSAASRFSSSYARNVIVRAGDATSTGMMGPTGVPSAPSQLSFVVFQCVEHSLGVGCHGILCFRGN